LIIFVIFLRYPARPDGCICATSTIINTIPAHSF
jgi:hypothetical protein